MEIAQLLEYAMTSHASDLFLSTGKLPAFRRFGEVVPEGDQPVTAEEIDTFRLAVLGEAGESAYREHGSHDAAFTLAPGYRYRLNFLTTDRGPAAVARPIYSGDQLFFEQLGLPDQLRLFCEKPRGLILVVGSAGNGKSTTLGAMVNHINRNFHKHIITLEDPIEYQYTDAAGLITQREINTDVSSFDQALRSALRESPDVIVIGEMRDLSTVQTAISAALTGHLVLTTTHTADTIQAVERIVDLFPEHQRAQVASDLSMALVGIAAQRLLPRKDGAGMIPALELLVGTPTVKRLIHERNFNDLEQAINRGQEDGMITFNRAIFQLFADGIVSLEAAEIASSNVDEFRLLLKGMESGVDSFRNRGDESEDGKFVDMRRLLRSAVKLGASDLLLSTGSSPVLRINGDLRALELPTLTGSDTQRLLYSIISPRQRVIFEEKRELDLALTVQMALSHAPDAPAQSFRFRVNGFFQRGTVGVVARVISDRIPTPEELRLPPQVLRLMTKQQGLILVTGPTGSGKSTTLASLINLVNRTTAKHIITIEDPIEYVHSNIMSLVEQRELHADTMAFATALKYALRQDPDVILVGEMRDIETIGAALTAAETGHLVLATLHTNSAPQTIDRIIDSFPAHQQNQIKLQLAGVLLGVISQRLLQRCDGKGRIAAFEIMMGTPPAAALIREGKTAQLQSILETSYKDGMITLERSLEELYSRGLVSADEVQSLTKDYQQTKAF